MFTIIPGLFITKGNDNRDKSLNFSAELQIKIFCSFTPSDRNSLKFYYYRQNWCKTDVNLIDVIL